MPKPAWLIAAPISATDSKANTGLYKFLVRLIRGENLSRPEAAEFFRELTDRNANPAQIAGALTALTAKGETEEEITGMMEVMIDQAEKIKTRYKNFINISGTGTSPAKTFNVSTAAAFVAAGAGIPVAKHTGRAVISQTGGAEVLGALGIELLVEPKVVKACLDGAGLCFMFSPKFHPTVRRVKDISRGLGIRTCLNLLEALANPAETPKHLLGVWHPSLLKPVAKALSNSRTERAWVVHGTDGLDEITISGETYVVEVEKGKVKKFKIKPEDFGLKPGSIDHLKAETPEESADIISQVLKGNRRDEARTLIIINAAAALMIGGVAKEPVKAARIAEQSIESHSAQIKLERLIQTTNRKKSGADD
ncbi:MAG: anthranilate phosphoribosyltransferase [Pyrinomonadaceae bacterium]